MPRPASAHALCVWGNLASTASSPLVPWIAKVPRAVQAHACAFGGTCLALHQHQRGLGARGCLDQHQLMPCAAGVTWLSQHPHQKSFGVPSWLEQYRLMLVMLGALFSHTSSTSGALVRGHASTSIDSCPVLMGAPCSQCIDTSRALVLQIKKIILFT